jgi:hypothetical protein
VITKLTRYKLSKGLAERAVFRALLYGSDPTRSGLGLFEQDVLDPDNMQRFSRRTFYDLYNSLTAMALPFSIQRRELVEQVAHRILTTRFSNP